MSFGKTVNLGNSIIGVSILAMPYCFVQSGVLLSVLLIVLSGFLTRLSCHFLLKSAFLSRRRSFELMVQDVLGSTGRFLVEVGLIGFLLGTCVAYFIMIGDLAPKILAEFVGIKYDQNLRIITVVLLSLIVALPLSLLKKVDSLTSLSVLSMILYGCLILKLMFETTDKFDKITPEKLDTISYWNLSGLLTTFPIFSMAMSCQTSLFEIFDSSVISSDLEAIKRDNSIIKNAIYMCSFVYIIVGLLGYMAFHEQTLYGNILLAFHPSLTTTLTKLGFIVSLLLSFPLCLFPCRTSVYSLTVGKTRSSFKFQPLANEAPNPTTFVGMSGDSNANGNHSNRQVFCDIDKSNIKNQNGNSNNNHSETLNYNGTKLFNSNSSNNLRTILPTIGDKPIDRIAMNNLKLTSMNNTNNNSSSSYTKLIDDDELTVAQDNDYDDDDHDLGGATNDRNKNPFKLSNLGLAHYPTRLYMSDWHFRLSTVMLIIVTVVLSLLFPHIEFILGIIGSTAGTVVCFVLPAFTFIKIGEHSRTELNLARLLLLIGLAMLIFCTYSTIHNASLIDSVPSH